MPVFLERGKYDFLLKQGRNVAIVFLVFSVVSTIFNLFARRKKRLTCSHLPKVKTSKAGCSK